MKQKIAILAATLLTLLALPATTMAVSAAKTDVTGVITNNGHVVVGAKVTVICDNHAKTDTTDAGGSYLVQFPATNCPTGATFSVTAKKNKLGGFRTSVVQSATTKLNVNVVNVDVPEFGIITGLAALAAGGAGFYLIRRRQIGQN